MTTTTTTTAMATTFAKRIAALFLALALFAGVAGSAGAASANPDRPTGFEGGGLGNARTTQPAEQLAVPARAGSRHGGSSVGLLPE